MVIICRKRIKAEIKMTNKREDEGQNEFINNNGLAHN